MSWPYPMDCNFYLVCKKDYTKSVKIGQTSVVISKRIVINTCSFLLDFRPVQNIRRHELRLLFCSGDKVPPGAKKLRIF